MQFITQANYFFLEGVVVQEGRRADSAEAKAKVAVCWPTLLLTAPAWRSRRAPERRYVCCCRRQPLAMTEHGRVG